MSSPSQPTALLVLGMHRSGTSAATRWLSLLGADLPEALMPSGTDNPSGHWESAELQRYHDAVLGISNLTWSTVGPLNPDWQHHDELQSIRSGLLEFLASNFSASSRFVVKDPRLCRILPLWLSVLEEFGATPRIVLPFRNPLEISRSLVAREGFSTRRAELLTLQYCLEAERASRDYPRVFIDFESLLDDWRFEAERMARRLDERWPRERSASTDAAIDAFIVPARRHHRCERHQVESESELGDWIGPTYNAFRGLVRAPHDGDSQDQLDSVFGEFERARNAFAPITVAETSATTQRSPVQRSIPSHAASPILVTGCIRSGTTLVGKILATARDAVYIHEPFNADAAWSAAFPVPIRYFYLAEHNGRPYENRFSKLLALDPEIARAWPSSHQRRLLDGINVPDPSSAVPILKDPLALFSLPWIRNRFGVRPVVVVRDPRDVVLSVYRCGWAHGWSRPLSVLNSQAALNERLETMASSLGVPGVHDAIARGHPMQGTAQLIYACYLACAYYVHAENAHSIGYERLTRSPAEQVAGLFDHFQLSATSATQAVSTAGDSKDFVPEAAHQTFGAPISIDELRSIRTASVAGFEGYDDIVPAFDRLRAFFPSMVQW